MIKYNDEKSIINLKLNIKKLKSIFFINLSFIN